MSYSELSSFEGSYDGSNSSASSDEEDGSEDSSEMMVIEIAFGKDKEDTIVVHWNDSPLVLAQVFF